MRLPESCPLSRFPKTSAKNLPQAGIIEQQAFCREQGIRHPESVR